MTTSDEPSVSLVIPESHHASELQGETLLDNHASQATLRRCGFEQYGIAPAHLFIRGQWRDHLLFQLVNERHVAEVSSCGGHGRGAAPSESLSNSSASCSCSVGESTAKYCSE